MAGSSGGPGGGPACRGHVPGPAGSSRAGSVRRGRAGLRPGPRRRQRALSRRRGGRPARRRSAGGSHRASAGTGRAGGPGGGGTGSVSSALSRLLESGASGYRWAAATIGSTSAASLELGSNGVPVMAIGGFTGSDPAPTLAQFEKLVAAHEIHYFVASGSGGPGGAGGGSGSGSQITAWVKAHFTGKTVGGMTVYDLTAPKTGS